MIATTYRIPYNDFHDVIKIKPIADVHLGNTYCDVNAFLEYIKEADDSTYYVGIGDFFDAIITSDLKRYQKHADATETDAILDEQYERGKEILWPIRKRIIGLGRGNHEDTIIRMAGTDLVKRLCDDLECEYLGYSGLIRIILRKETGAGRSIFIRWHHGWGGGSRTQGADLTKFSKDTMHWDADVYLYGHVHRKQSDRIPRIGLSGQKIISKPKLIGICGTFLKTYSDTTDSTYSERAGYPATEIGGITLCIKPKRHWVKVWIDI